MEDQAGALDRWRELHGRAAQAYAVSVAAVVDPAKPTPAGGWSAADVLAHVRDEHTDDEAGQAVNLVQLQMQTLDLAVHGWDLARSHGRWPDLDDELCLELHAAFAPYTDLMAQEDAFAPPVGVPPEAAPLDRLVALCGRDPSWSRADARSGR